MCKEYWTLSSLIRHIVTRQMMAKYGIWSPDSQTKMIKIGWRTKGYGGMTSKSPWEQQQIRRITPTWSHSHFGCSGAKSLRSRAVMIPVTHSIQQVTVWPGKHSDQRSQVMAILEMAVFGPVNSAWEAAPFNIAVSTNQHWDGFQQAECSGNIQSANKIGFWCDSQYFYGNGQYWWLVEEEVLV